MGTLATNVWRRGARYYYRARVPADLVPVVRRRELTRSLDTTEPSIARLRATKAGMLASGLWTTLRRMPSLTLQEVDDLVRRWFQQRLDEDRLDKSTPWNSEALDTYNGWLLDDSPDAIELFDPPLPWPREIHERTEAEAEYVDWQGNVRQFRWEQAAPIADEILAAEGIQLTPDSNEYRLLCQGITRGMAEFHRLVWRRAKGDWTDIVRDPLFKTPAAPLSATPTKPAARSAETLSELLERCLIERKGIEAKTQHDYRTALRALIDVMGIEKPIERIQKRDVLALKDALLHAPTNWSKRFKGKTLPQVAKLNKAAGEPGLTPKTINQKYLGPLRVFFRWAVSNDLMTMNPALEVRVEMPKGHKRRKMRHPFSPEHLETIFSSPLFKGCKSVRVVWEPGSVFIDDHRRWALLLALLTGARANELGQLRLEDVRVAGEILYLEITEAPADDKAGAKKLKTEAARRVVPIHPELVRVGFLDYVDRMRAKGHVRLFPDWDMGKDGYYSSRFSKWFARFLTNIGLHDPRLVFHSFRHTFKDALRAAGVEEPIQRVLMGHADASVAAGYGMGYPLPVLAQAVAKVSFPTLANLDAESWVAALSS